MANSREIIEIKPEHRGKKSTTFTGRPQGTLVRQQLKLEHKDSDSCSYEVQFPADTSTIAPSFYLGLFFLSIKKLGNIEKFNKKYTINFPFATDKMNAILHEDIKDCEREAENELLGKTGLDSLI